MDSLKCQTSTATPAEPGDLPWGFSEIKSRLRREPEIREMYVEGSFDRDLYRWVLKHLGLNDVVVYPISTVEVSEELLRQHNLTNGERQKVQAAAQEFSDVPELHRRVLFLIDADLDYLLDRAAYSPPLLGTAGTSAELIMWKRETLQKFFSMGLACNNAEKMVEQVMAFIEPIVSAICELRAAKERLGATWQLVDMDKAFSRRSTFSFEEFCAKVADKNAARKQFQDDLPEALSEVREPAFLYQVRRQYRGWRVVLLLDGDRSHTANASQALAHRLKIRLLWLPKRAPELNPMDTLWGQAKDAIVANKQYAGIDEQTESFIAHLHSLSNKEALQTSGVLSEHFWLKRVLSKNFCGPA